MGLYLGDRMQVVYNELCLKLQKALRSASDSSVAREYLKERKIENFLIEEFSIGWCPKFAKLPQEQMFPLRGRIIFPIKDEFGDVVAFSGRLPTNENPEDGEKRWWNEPFNKRFFLYGMDIAKKYMHEKDYAIVVEGPLDALRCHEIGLKNTVAVLSANLTDQHISKISRFTTNFILMFDGDSAGRNSAVKTKEKLERNKGYGAIDIDLNHEGVAFDPDEYVTSFGSSALLKLIINASDIRKKESSI